MEGEAVRPKHEHPMSRSRAYQHALLVLPLKREDGRGSFAQVSHHRVGALLLHLRNQGRSGAGQGLRMAHAVRCEGGG